MFDSSNKQEMRKSPSMLDLGGHAGKVAKGFFPQFIKTSFFFFIRFDQSESFIIYPSKNTCKGERFSFVSYLNQRGWCFHCAPDNSTCVQSKIGRQRNF